MLWQGDYGVVEAEERSWSLLVTCPSCFSRQELSRIPSLRPDPPMTIYLSCAACGAPFRAVGRLTFYEGDDDDCSLETSA